MPDKPTCVRSVFGEDGYDALENLEEVAAYNGDEAVYNAVEALVEYAEDMSTEYVDDYRNYLINGYNAMWDDSAFYTGNFRGSLKIDGVFEINPLETIIYFDEDWFMTPKMLPSLKTRVVHRTWTTKSGVTTSKDYVYPSGRMVKITGEDYRERVPPTPYVMAYLDEIDDAERAKAGVN